MIGAEGADPTLTVRARSGLGWALLEAGRPAEAAESFATLLAAAPDDPIAPDAALGRGRALELAKKPADALAAYALVTAKYPSTPRPSSPRWPGPGSWSKPGARRKPHRHLRSTSMPIPTQKRLPAESGSTPCSPSGAGR